MATTRTATTRWHGGLADGSGQVTLETSGIGTFDVSWPSRAEQANGLTSPEELIAAAHSACYSMALSHALGQQGSPPRHLETHAEVDFQPGQGITQIRLSVRGDVPDIDADTFTKTAEDAKANCPVSKALAGVEITLEASLA
jgi:osmotically inducible protein OsmC